MQVSRHGRARHAWFVGKGEERSPVPSLPPEGLLSLVLNSPVGRIGVCVGSDSRRSPRGRRDTGRRAGDAMYRRCIGATQVENRTPIREEDVRRRVPSFSGYFAVALSPSASIRRVYRKRRGVTPVEDG